MNDKQARFVAEYLVDLNATQAAIRAGYSKRTANEQGSRLLAKASIREAVNAAQRKRLNGTELTATRVLEEIRRLAFADLTQLCDDQGNLKPLSELTPEQGALISSFEVLVKNAQAGDGKTDVVHKFRLWDKPKMLDLLAKHLGLLKDDVHVTGSLKLTWQQ